MNTDNLPENIKKLVKLGSEITGSGIGAGLGFLTGDIQGVGNVLHQLMKLGKIPKVEINLTARFLEKSYHLE